MYASRIVASFFAFGVISAFASPAPVEKRQDVSDVLAVVNTLQASTGAILPQIDGLINSNRATEANLTPLLQQLSTALDVGASSLDSLKGKVNQNTGGSKDEVASKVAAVYANVANTVSNAKTKNPHVYPVFIKFGLDAALLKILLGLELVLVGVVKLVGGLLKGLGGLLSGVGFLLTLLLLGLL